MGTFKERCITLRQKGHTLSEIVELTGRPKTSVYFHIRSFALPPEKIYRIRTAAGERIRPYAIVRLGKSDRKFKPLTTWTPSSALLLGHLLFDGEIRRGRCIYNNRNEALIERFEMLMRSIYAYKPTRNTNTKTGVIRTAYFNVEMAAHLQERAMHLLKKVPLLTPAAKREFLRAFFDDEGCMDFRPTTNIRKIRGYQKDRKVLKVVQAVLASFGIESRIVKPNEVVIVGKSNLMKFEREVSFSPGVQVNGNRTNSRWKKHVEKRKLLRMAITSFKN